MIEKAFLPVWLVNAKFKQFLADDVAQRLNPHGHSDSMSRKGSKEMNVVGHDDIATNSDIILLGIDRKGAKGLMDFVTCQQTPMFIRIEGDEVERTDIGK